MFDLHPIVRQYAYDRMAQTTRTDAHTQLRDYFAAVPEVENVTTLEDLAPVIELYHHMVRAGQYDEAWELFHDRIDEILNFQFGAYQLSIDLLIDLCPQGTEQTTLLKSKPYQAHILNELANKYSLTGQSQKAVSFFEKIIVCFKPLVSKTNLAIALHNLAENQAIIGALQSAEASCIQSIYLSHKIKDKSLEATTHLELGKLRVYRGAWSESEAEFRQGLHSFKKQNNIQAQGIAWAYQAFAKLQRIREGESQEGKALEAAVQALYFADEDARTDYPVESDYIRAYWLLGAAHRVNGDRTQSNTHLNEALTRCRTINMVDHEANILLDLARLRAEERQTDEAVQLAHEALLITERCGYVLQGADVQLFLAQQAIERGDRSTALTHAQQARQLATCDGGDYTYKVAYDEAGALLTTLGEGNEL